MSLNASLQTAVDPNPAAGTSQLFDFSTMPPASVSDMGSPTWLVRAHNIVFALTDLHAGDHLTRDDVDEHMLVVLASDQRLDMRANGDVVGVAGQSIAVIPPGTSEISAVSGGRIVRLFALSASDLRDRCPNDGYYAAGASRAATAKPWPEPRSTSVHVYPRLDDIPARPERLGRIFRSRHAMVNFLYPRVGPRDPSTLSPHTHGDFEQLSYADSGEYVHHLREAWGKDRRAWREDQHVRVGSPSLIIIPPAVIHTSEAIGDGTNQLLDIFAGPRADFSSRDGWVLNANDYPAPVS
jgi:hypothetical protein